MFCVARSCTPDADLDVYPSSTYAFRAAETHILLVDSNRAERHRLQRALESQHVIITTCDNARDAMETLRDGIRETSHTQDTIEKERLSIDVCICDVQMVLQNGQALLDAIVVDPKLKDVPVISTYGTGCAVMTLRCAVWHACAALRCHMSCMMIHLLIPTSSDFLHSHSRRRHVLMDAPRLSSLPLAPHRDGCTDATHTYDTRVSTS